MKKLAIIGLGKMGTALLQGILDTGIYQPHELIGCDILVDDREKNDQYYSIETTRDSVYASGKAEVVLLAIKPQVMPGVLKSVSKQLQDKLVISIAAGITIGSIKEKLLHSRVIRVMPNTPSLVKAGIAAISAGPDATGADLELVKKLFSGVGEVVQVEEKLMDAVTGLSGSGPAYIYIIIEALSDGGVLMGLPRELATRLAASTVLGAARMVLETGKHPGELKDMVTSPGGTTIKAVEELEKNNLRGTLISAVKAAAQRSRELNSK
jgi:pyrroline-5-carboxylate reductase